MRRGLIAGFIALCGHLAAPVQAQDIKGLPATLLADQVVLGADSQLIASGAVEVVQGDARLKASRIIYHPDTDSLSIEGPITLTEGIDTVVVASSAELSSDMRNGILRSARAVLDQRMQIAAAEIHRVDGRYSQFYKTVASSCSVCPSRPVPLWRIRAQRVVHDREEQQLYFDNARFEVAGIPIMWVPRLRLPDPTLKRATGFLQPTFRSTDELGFGVKIPYFIRIGDHKDLTLTPYISTGRTTTLEFRYRQAFRNGDLHIAGALSDDDLIPGQTRGYLFADGSFDLPQDFTLSFDIEASSDDTYLIDYDYSSKDRLDSAIALTRTRRDEYIGAELVNLWSLRADEDNQTQPYIVGDAIWERRFEPASIGGIASWSVEAHTHQRRSEADGVAGRDISRLSGAFEWQKGWIGAAGLVFSAQTRLEFDHTVVQNDSAFPDPVSLLTPYAAVEMRWPLVRAGRGGASHVVEPVVQLVWSPDDGEATPNDESTELELDEGNLFSLSRFPGGDQVERGFRANIGLTWTRHDPMGWSFGVTLGRILRSDDLGQFTGNASLSGENSDWLAALQLELPDIGLTLTNRALFDDRYVFSKNELRFNIARDTWSAGGSYVWMEASAAEGRPDNTNELRVFGSYRVNDRWSTSLGWRYDLATDRSARVDFGLEYRTECIKLALQVGRRFTSSAQLRPTTDIGFQIGLEGFGNSGGRPAARHRCMS